MLEALTGVMVEQGHNIRASYTRAGTIALRAAADEIERLQQEIQDMETGFHAFSEMEAKCHD